MARASVENERPQPAPAPTASANGTSAAVDNYASAQRAFELTDAAGHRAYAWPTDEGWMVDADDAALRRRVQRALKKPLWVREDVPDEYGVPWSTRVQLQPDDPRYANRLHWKWDQLGLGDVGVRVVTLPDRQPVRTTPAGSAAQSLTVRVSRVTAPEAVLHPAAWTRQHATRYRNAVRH